MAFNDRTAKEVSLGLSHSARNVVLAKYPTSYIAMDLETTGLDPNVDGIVEIAGVRIVDGEAVDTFQTLVNTEARLSREASQINGITRAMLRGAPRTDEAMASFLEWSEGLPMLGHNAKRFDKAFVERACTYSTSAAPREWYDTMELASKVYGQRLSLANLCKRCDVQNERAHRALSDAMATHMCYQFMRATILEVTTDARNFPAPISEGPLSGEVVCFTGNRATIDRHTLMSLVVENGGSLSNNVTLKTTMLVKVANVRSMKEEKAKEYSARTGIKTIDFVEFLTLINALDTLGTIQNTDISTTETNDYSARSIEYKQSNNMPPETDFTNNSAGTSSGCLVALVVICLFFLMSCISLIW